MTAQTEFDTWVEKNGEFECKRIMRAHLRRKLEVSGRPPRQKFPWSEYKRMYERQGGICPLCQEVMPLIRGKIEMDHINPGLVGEEFNARTNRQVVCRGCNREKSALSIPAQAKRYSKPMTEILKREA
jgi:5-methylcytosine-specific restriction endonuclease McrA